MRPSMNLLMQTSRIRSQNYSVFDVHGRGLATALVMGFGCRPTRPVNGHQGRRPKAAEGGDSQKRFGSRLGVLLQMPIIGPDSVTTGATDNVAFLTLATVGDIGIALGRLDRSPSNMKGGARYTRLIAPAIADQGKLAAMPLLMGVAHVEFDRLRAAEMSGKIADPPRRIVQIGAGTIGSLAAEILVREGFGDHWTTIDADYLLPHNLARHNLSAMDVGLPKALGLAHRLGHLRTDLAADAIVADVLNLAEHRDAIAGAVRSADLVIDAAASVPVARFLCIRKARPGGQASSSTRPALRLSC
jgi:ThiF family